MVFLCSCCAGCTAVLVHNAIRRFFPGPVEMAHNYVKMGVHLASSKVCVAFLSPLSGGEVNS